MRRSLSPIIAAPIVMALSACVTSTEPAAPAAATTDAASAAVDEVAADTTATGSIVESDARTAFTSAHAAPGLRVPLPRPRYLGSREHTCLAAAIYYEAHGEGDDGMIGVGHVILNRLDARPAGTTICDVVYEPGQFGWTRRISRKQVAVGKSRQWRDASTIADKLIAGAIPDTTSGATSFYSTLQFRKSPPRWAENNEETARIGNHVFIR